MLTEEEIEVMKNLVDEMTLQAKTLVVDRKWGSVELLYRANIIASLLDRAGNAVVIEVVPDEDRQFDEQISEGLNAFENQHVQIIIAPIKSREADAHAPR